VIIDETLPLYFRPDTGNRSLIGVEIEPDPYGYDPDNFWPPPLPESLVSVTAMAARRIPAYERATMGRTWSGLDGFTPDGQQIIGPVPGVEGIQLLCGGNGHGFKVGPAVGKALAEVITKGHTTVADMTQFELARFGGATEFEHWPGLYGD
jgi:sarcosine oxidase subunit beta